VRHRRLAVVRTSSSKQGYESLERISAFVSEEHIEVTGRNALADLAVVIEAYTEAKNNLAPYSEAMIG
jgi:hypothetical protein